jgi:hypothetical protein
MISSVSHDSADEPLETKARWFKSLTPEERMQVFDEFTELLLSVNPGLLETKANDAAETKTDIRIVSKA